MQDDRLSRSLGYALVRAFRRVNRECNALLRPHGLSAEQAHILLLLWFDGPMKIGALQRELLLSSGTLTGAIDRMEKSGLVKRVQDGDDGRAFRVEPARIDPKRKRAIERALEGFEKDGFPSLTAPERRELLRLLAKIAAPAR
jgi:DNA-binding MarR family transcriptional regulator